MKVSKEQFDLFITNLERGSTKSDAAALAGISYTAIIQLEEQAASGDEDAIAKVGAIMAANARAADEHLTAAKAAAKNNFKAHMTLYQMLRPERFSSKREVSVMVNNQLQAQQVKALGPSNADAKKRLFDLAIRLFAEEPSLWTMAQIEMGKIEALRRDANPDTPMLERSKAFAMSEIDDAVIESEEDK